MRQFTKFVLIMIVLGSSCSNPSGHSYFEEITLEADGIKPEEIPDFVFNAKTCRYLTLKIKTGRSFRNEKVAVIWYFIGKDKDYEIKLQKLSATDTTTTLSSRLEKPEQGWPLGQYMAKISYGNQKKAEEIHFTIL